MSQPVSAENPDAIGVHVPEAQLARFCGKCGSPLQSDWTDCLACATPPQHDEPVRSYQAEMRDLKSALWLYFSLFAVSVIMIIAATASRNDAGIGLQVFGAVTMTLVVMIWSIARRDTVTGLLSLQPSLKWYLLAVLCPIGTYLTASVCMMLANKLIGLNTINYLKPYTDADLGFGWAILLICVQPAIFEELAFRGVVQGSLQAVIGPWQAVFASAVMFAILHLSIPSIPHLVIMGFVLAWLRLRSGSLYPGMIVHFLHNLFALLDEKSGGLLPWS